MAAPPGSSRQHLLQGRHLRRVLLLFLLLTRCRPVASEAKVKRAVSARRWQGQGKARGQSHGASPGGSRPAPRIPIIAYRDLGWSVGRDGEDFLDCNGAGRSCFHGLGIMLLCETCERLLAARAMGPSSPKLTTGR
jgi:hypothetical protein